MPNDRRMRRCIRRTADCGQVDAARFATPRASDFQPRERLDSAVVDRSALGYRKITVVLDLAARRAERPEHRG